MAKHGMYRRLDYDTSFLTSYAMAFVHNDNFPRQVEDYERNLRIALMEKGKVEKVLNETNASYQEQLQELKEENK